MTYNFKNFPYLKLPIYPLSNSSVSTRNAPRFSPSSLSIPLHNQYQRLGSDNLGGSHLPDTYPSYAKVMESLLNSKYTPSSILGKPTIRKVKDISEKYQILSALSSGHPSNLRIFM